MNANNSEKHKQIQAGRDYFERIIGNVFTGPVQFFHTNPRLLLAILLITCLILGLVLWNTVFRQPPVDVELISKAKQEVQTLYEQRIAQLEAHYSQREHDYQHRLADYERERQADKARYHQLVDEFVLLREKELPAQTIDEALQELAQGNTEEAKALLAQIAEKKAAKGQALAQEAENVLQKVLTLGQARNNQRLISVAYGNLGNIFSSSGQMDKAIEHYQHALTIAREIGDRQHEGRSLGNLGNAYHALGQVKKAISYYEQALTIARDIGHRQNEGSWLGNLGVAYHALGQVDKAIEYYEQAFTIARDIGHRQNEGKWLGNLGIAYHTLGQEEKAKLTAGSCYFRGNSVTVC